MPQYKSENYETNQNLLADLRGLAREKEATPSQISLAGLLNKKRYIVPIPGSRTLGRIKENFLSCTIELSEQEMQKMDRMLDRIDMSWVFGGSAIKQ